MEWTELLHFNFPFPFLFYVWFSLSSYLFFSFYSFHFLLQFSFHFFPKFATFNPHCNTTFVRFTIHMRHMRHACSHPRSIHTWLQHACSTHGWEHAISATFMVHADYKCELLISPLCLL